MSGHAEAHPKADHGHHAADDAHETHSNDDHAPAPVAPASYKSTDRQAINLKEAELAGQAIENQLKSMSANASGQMKTLFDQVKGFFKGVEGWIEGHAEKVKKLLGFLGIKNKTVSLQTSATLKVEDHGKKTDAHGTAHADAHVAGAHH